MKATTTRLAPDLFVFSSAEVWPVIREYERSSTAILNGYVHPRVAGYLTALEARLKGLGAPARPMKGRSGPEGVQAAFDAVCERFPELPRPGPVREAAE